MRDVTERRSSVIQVPAARLEARAMQVRNVLINSRQHRNLLLKYSMRPPAH